MPKAVHATSAVTATAFAGRFHPNLPPDIIEEESERAWATPEQPANDCKRRCHETQKELALANRAELPEQLSASICRDQPADQRCRHERRSGPAAAPHPADRYGSRPAVARLYRQGRNAYWRHR